MDKADGLTWHDTPEWSEDRFLLPNWLKMLLDDLEGHPPVILQTAVVSRRF